MSGLLASEFRRFRSRRLVKVLVAVEALAVVATGVIVSSRRSTRSSVCPTC
jgi:hypothetical protein